MTITDATYYANYEDHDGFDEVRCKVDTEAGRVVSFGEVVSCRWDDGVMCTDENIQLADGREFGAVKDDEYQDAVSGGFASDYDLSTTILFDSDQLECAVRAAGFI